MAYRVLEVTLLSAKDLKNVNLFTRMEVYAVATISGNPMTRQCTPPDPDGGRNPTWNATLRFNVPPTAEVAKGGYLHIVLLAERTFGADREVGEVIVPLAEVLTGGGLGAPSMPQFASYQVRKVHRAETRGLLYLTYRLGPIVVPPHAKPPANDWPVVGYPAPQEMPSSPAKPHGPSPPSAKPAGHVDVPSWPTKPKPASYVDVPPSPKPSGYTTAPPKPSPKPTGQVVSMPPSSKPPGYATAPSKPEGHVPMPPSPNPTGQLVSMRSFPKPVEHIVSMPPSQQPGGRAVSMPPSPKPAEHEVSIPPSPKPAGGHVAMLSSPKPSVHAVPPSPNSDTPMAVSPSRNLAGGYIAMPSSPKGQVVGERILTRTDIYRAPIKYQTTC